MPVIAAAAIVTGLVETSALVAGLTYASAGLYVVGKATNNNDLMKLSAVTGLAAAGTGIYQGLSSASSLAASGADVGADAGEISGSGVTDLAGDAGGAGDAASGSAEAFTPSDTVSSTYDQPLGQAPASQTGLINNPPPIDASLQGAPVAQDAASMSSTSASVSPQEAPTGMINQTTQAAMPAATDANPPPVDSSLQGSPGYSDATNAQLPNDFGKTVDPGILSKAKAWWGTLDPASKLAVSQFVAKGAGAIGDFVGPRADAMRAQAGLTNAQSAMTQQQTANMAQPAMKIPKMTYTKGQ